MMQQVKHILAVFQLFKGVVYLFCTYITSEQFKKKEKNISKNERKKMTKKIKFSRPDTYEHTHTFVRTHCPSCYVVTKGQGVHLRAAS